MKTMTLKIRSVVVASIILGALLALAIFWQRSETSLADRVSLEHSKARRTDVVDLGAFVGPQMETSWTQLKDHLLQHVSRGLGNRFIVDSPNETFEEKKLLDRLLRDEVFQDQNNIEGFLKIAEALLEERGIVKKACEEGQGEEMPTKELALSEGAKRELHAALERMAVTHKAAPKTNGITIKLFQDRDDFTLSNWQLFHKRINQYEMYAGDDPVVDGQLDDLVNLPIVDMEQASGGTQIKLMYTLSNGGRAIFKPMRFPRDTETQPDHYIWSDFERHISEIAAFHLDRLLGFHRVPPAAGRVINITEHVKGMADARMLKTVFVSPAGNLCFYGRCKYYCDSSHAVCGHPELLEGSLATYLVNVDDGDLKSWTHPWKRSYSKSRRAAWQSDPTYCTSVRANPPYNEGRIILDLMDMSVFDFLQGNLDRHKYWTLKSLGSVSFPLHLDNGRGFGNSRQDYLDVLAPVYHCCLMRFSTLKTLMSFQFEEKLSDRMRRSLARDVLTSRAPILHERHLAALDRRVTTILENVYKCIRDNGGNSTSVVVDDGF